MFRTVLTLLLATTATTSSAATVTIINQQFYATLIKRDFSRALVWNGVDLVPFSEASKMSWAELGLPGFGLDFGQRLVIDYLITADESLDPDTLTILCRAGGTTTWNSCGGPRGGGWPVSVGPDSISYSYGGNSDFWFSLGRLGGGYGGENDGYGDGVTADGRPWLFEEGYKWEVELTAVPLPSSAALLLGSLGLLLWRRASRKT